MFFSPGFEAFLFLWHNQEWFAGFFKFIYFFKTPCLAAPPCCDSSGWERSEKTLAFSLAREDVLFIFLVAVGARNITLRTRRCVMSCDARVLESAE